jgi:Leucine-rich repeat (LRR) protein
LDLWLNNLSAIPLLPKSVISIALDYNHFVRPEGTFSKLISFTLSANRVAEVSPDISLVALTTLDLSLNKLRAIPGSHEDLPQHGIVSPLWATFPHPFNSSSLLSII